MSFLGPEAVIDPAFSYISDNQAAKLADLEARGFTNVLDLEPFAAMRLMDPRGIAAEAQFPLLLGIPLEDIPMPKVGRATTVTYRVLWVVLAAHAGTTDVATGTYDLLPQEAAKRLAMRYIVAVREMLKDMHQHAARPYHWTLGRARYGDTYNGQSGEWIADAQLETLIEHTE